MSRQFPLSVNIRVATAFTTTGGTVEGTCGQIFAGKSSAGGRGKVSFTGRNLGFTGARQKHQSDNENQQECSNRDSRPIPDKIK